MIRNLLNRFMPGNSAQGDERALVARLVAAYRYGTDQAPLDQSSMWHGFFVHYQSAAHAAFYTADLEASQRILADPGSSKILYGFDNLYDDAVRDMKSAEKRAAFAETMRGKLVQLAEAIGAIWLHNPEAPRDQQVPDIVQVLEQGLGFSIATPAIYPDEFGLETVRGVLSDRAIPALYQAHRLRQLAVRPAVRICEIGGGLGRTALYAMAAGFTDYTLVDIPLTGISQGYYLMRALGPSAVRLPGERGSAPIRLMTPEDFLASNERFDIVLNVDSMTEFAPDTAARYVAKIAQCADRFLSINHEGNSFRMFDLLAGKRSQRFPYWLRPGYVEEIVDFR